MANTKNQEIKVPAITDVTLIGEQSVRLKFKEIDLKNEAQKFGGIVVEEKEEPDGVDLVIEFTDEALMQVWKNSMGIK